MCLCCSLLSLYLSRLQLKSMDANRYATKKTIAQGMLDIALLTANASQLKYILQVGEKHEFYGLMLTLISISIILQVSVRQRPSGTRHRGVRIRIILPFDYLPHIPWCS